MSDQVLQDQSTLSTNRQDQQSLPEEQLLPNLRQELEKRDLDRLSPTLLEAIEELVTQREQVLARALTQERERLIRATVQAETLRRINRHLLRASSPDELLQVLAEPGIAAGATRAHLVYIDSDQAGQAEWAQVVAVWQREGPPACPPGARFRVADYSASRLLTANRDQVKLIADVATDERLDRRARDLFLQGGGHTIAIIPLSRPGRWIGLISLGWDRLHQFSEQEVEIYRAMISRASSAVENRRLLSQTQQSLVDIQQSEQLLRSLIDATPDWIFVKDRRHRFQLVNRSYAAAFDLDPEQFVGKDNLEMGWPEELVKGDPEQGIRGIWVDDREVMESGQIKSIPHDLVKVRGELRVFDTIKIPLKDANGSVWGLLGFARDMTELKRTEDEVKSYRDHLEALVQQRTAQLIESRQLLEKTFASLRDAVFLIDANTGQIVDCNPSATEIFGYSRKEMLGRTTVFLHVDEGSFLGYQQRLSTALERDGFLSLPEFQMKRRTGQIFSTELGVAPLEDDQGSRFGWVTVVRDITERKRLEQYVLRTERLAAMGRLAAALAHEINNPLHSIASSLELVLDFPLEEKRRREYLHAVQLEIGRLRALTNRILDFARPPKVERRFTHVPHIVRHALTLADKQLRERHIRVDTRLPNDLPSILASPDQLTQVFLNLIINAIDEMPDGGDLRITARQVQDWLELTFSDSGPGISPELVPLIFEPFYTTKADGTGLGLSISHNIVQQYGGTMSARNASGGGAVFTVKLPIAHQEYDSMQGPG